MSIMNFLSYANIYHVLLYYTKICYRKIKILVDYLLNSGRWKPKMRIEFLRSNYFLLSCILFLIFCLFVNQQFHTKKKSLKTLPEEQNSHLIINRVRNIAIPDRNLSFNIKYSLIINDLPKWLNQYEITHLLNFYWLQNGGYLWHLQRMFDLRQNLINTTIHFNQIFSENADQTNISDYLNHHPEHGIIIDTASDPIQPLFPLLPQSSLPLEKTCHSYPWLKTWYPCQTRSAMISSFSFKPLITYTLYDVTIDVCDQCKRSSSVKTNHYDEMIYLFDSKQQLTNETVFVKQILPRLIRLLALVPQTALILFPYLSTKVYVQQYINVLIEREFINDTKRFLEYNSSEIYHANVIYSTSSPRSDLILLNRILMGNKPPARRELILVIRTNFADDSYRQIIQTINQFELPKDFEYLHIHEYTEDSYDLKKISHLFSQARIVIGMASDQLSHIVWCLPRTHIIEMIQKSMTTDYYEISLQLQFNYWLVMSTKTNQIDIIDFRNLMMRVLMDIDA